MIHSQLDIGWEIGIVIFWIGCGMFVLGTLMFIIGFISDSDFGDFAVPVGGLMGLLGAIAAIICFLVTFPPFSMQYHTFKPISGYVQSVSSRFLSDGNGGTNQKFTVEIGGQVYGVNDSRASQLHVGSPVTILCEQTFETNGTPGYDCNWGKFGLNK